MLVCRKVERPEVLDKAKDFLHLIGNPFLPKQEVDLLKTQVKNWPTLQKFLVLPEEMKHRVGAWCEVHWIGFFKSLKHKHLKDMDKVEEISLRLFTRDRPDGSMNLANVTARVSFSEGGSELGSLLTVRSLLLSITEAAQKLAQDQPAVDKQRAILKKQREDLVRISSDLAAIDQRKNPTKRSRETMKVELAPAEELNSSQQPLGKMNPWRELIRAMNATGMEPTNEAVWGLIEACVTKDQMNKLKKSAADHLEKPEELPKA
ncbi:Fc.00g077870.m01.CDS01 [Cosmosporella sp. VM-42]